MGVVLLVKELYTVYARKIRRLKNSLIANSLLTKANNTCGANNAFNLYLNVEHAPNPA